VGISDGDSAGRRLGAECADLAGQRRFPTWYEAWTSLPAGGHAGPFKVPTSLSLDTGDDSNDPRAARHDQIKFAQHDYGAGGDAGVEIQWGNVGTRNVNAGDPARSDTSTFRLDLGQAYPPNMAAGAGPLYDENHTPNVTNSVFRNQVFAKPTFPLGFAGNKEAMRARFSLANWGSQFSDPTSNAWSPIPGGTDVQYLNANSEMRFRLARGDDGRRVCYQAGAQRNKYSQRHRQGTADSGGRAEPHQCMLVELSSTDPSIIITRSSIYQNMNVGQASTFRRFAQVSVVGLAPISPKPRDVYLYLHTFNMPQKADKQPAPTPGIANTMSFDRQNMASTQQPRHEVEDYAAFVPTYIVHAYHDTGRKKKLRNGKTVTVVSPQTAFGYFMLHEGDLVGWETRIYGAEKLTDQYYVVRVPNTEPCTSRRRFKRGRPPARRHCRRDDKPSTTPGSGTGQGKGCRSDVWVHCLLCLVSFAGNRNATLTCGGDPTERVK
jgi:hypothetical protein